MIQIIVGPCLVETEESSYDDEVEIIITSELKIVDAHVPLKTLKVNSLELADILKGILPKVILSDKKYLELLWDTGKNIAVQKVSPDVIAMSLPVGNDEMHINIKELKKLIIDLYSNSFEALLALGVTRS